MPSRRPVESALIAAILSVLLSSCSAGYYTHTLWGGARLLLQRRPIARVMADRETPEELRERLRLVDRLLSFASVELGLQSDGSYRSYVDLDRRYAVWNVVAAPELSLDPVTWCFPIAGCVAYRGYFSEDRARHFAERLRADGLDVEVGGVAAYSTLGYFADPVLSTFVFWAEHDLAALLFHELAHLRVYAKDSTAFNESFATAVELVGLERWLATQQEAEMAAAIRKRRHREEEVVALLLEYRARLGEVYGSGETDDWKRRRKGELLRELQGAYASLRSSGGGTPGYDAWFEEGVDNASLASIASYHRWVAAFEALLASLDGDLDAFYAASETLAALPDPERERRLEEWLAKADQEPMSSTSW